MSRLTREKDEYPCRVCRGVNCEEHLVYSGDCPDYCILMEYANRLALYEDAAARGEIPWLGEEEQTQPSA